MPDIRNYREPQEQRTNDGKMPRSMFVIVIVTALLICALFTVLSIRMFRSGNGEFTTRSSTERRTGPASGEPTSPAVFSPQGAIFTVASDSNTVALTTGISSKYAALVDVTTGKILAGKNENARFSPASMTKVMTLLVLAEHLTEADLDADVCLSDEIYSYVHPSDKNNRYYGCECWGGASNIGDTMKLRDAMYGIGVKSAADCSIMAVFYLCEDEASFVELMNAECIRLGLKDTHFDNVIGYESEENYTTAAEMAVILQTALECDLIENILTTDSHTFQAAGFNSSGDWVTYNAHFYSTLFNGNSDCSSRFRSAGIGVGGKLALTDLSFCGGKTGTLGSSPNFVYSLASFADAKNEIGHRYLLITGETTDSAAVISDAKLIYNGYAK